MWSKAAIRSYRGVAVGSQPQVASGRPGLSGLGHSSPPSGPKRARTGGDYFSREPAKVVVFLDYQNVYRRARDTFHDALDPSYCGQIIPVRLAQLIVARGLDRKSVV